MSNKKCYLHLCLDLTYASEYTENAKKSIVELSRFFFALLYFAFIPNNSIFNTCHWLWQWFQPPSDEYEIFKYFVISVYFTVYTFFFVILAVVAT